MERKAFGIICSTVLFLVFSLGTAAAFEVGTASWYGGKFQGRKTANGEIFDTNKFTAAHRTLPFHTKVKVTNLENGKTTTVRINDRGPFVRGRIIDLSRAAAKELDMIHSGTAKVRIEIIGAADSIPLPEPEIPEKPPERPSGPAAGADSATAGSYKIQLGSFSIEENAKRMKEYLQNRGLTAAFEYGPDGAIRVVIAGVAEDVLPKLLARLKQIGVTEYLLRKES
jgi:rare lipoprotein A